MRQQLCQVSSDKPQKWIPLPALLVKQAGPLAASESDGIFDLDCYRLQNQPTKAQAMQLQLKANGDAAVVHRPNHNRGPVQPAVNNKS
jgi:hypothetical protein